MRLYYGVLGTYIVSIIVSHLCLIWWRLFTGFQLKFQPIEKCGCGALVQELRSIPVFTPYLLCTEYKYHYLFLGLYERAWGDLSIAINLYSVFIVY